MKKKFGMYAALAIAVLAVIGLVIGCVAPLGGGEDGLSTIPEGKGVVWLNFNDNSRATYMPKNYTIADFAEFTVTFTPSGSGVLHSENITNTVTTGVETITPIALAEGTYTLVVTGYADSARAKPMGIYTHSGTITITAGSTGTSIPVALKPIADGTAATDEYGTLSWDITNNVAYALTGSITLTRIGSVGAASVNINQTDFGTATSGSTLQRNNATIPSGYYYMDLAMVSNSITKNYRHIVHIYKNMETIFDYSFTNNHFGITSGAQGGTIGFTENPDYAPVLSKSGGSQQGAAETGANGNTAVVLSKTANDTIEFTVTNAANGLNGAAYATISWYCSDLALELVANNATYMASTATGGDFNGAANGVYQILVSGLDSTGDNGYSTEIWIKIID